MRLLIGLLLLSVLILTTESMSMVAPPVLSRNEMLVKKLDRKWKREAIFEDKVKDYDKYVAG